jgi:hypothetical protein
MRPLGHPGQHQCLRRAIGPSDAHLADLAPALELATTLSIPPNKTTGIFLAKRGAVLTWLDRLVQRRRINERLDWLSPRDYRHRMTSSADRVRQPGRGRQGTDDAST